MINIPGLALGMTCVILIFVMVKYHLSFDNFHRHRDRIYRITTELHGEKISYNPGVPYPLKEVFSNDYTVAEKMARVCYISKRVISVRGLDSKSEEDIAFADPAFFDIMTLPLLRGNKQTLLQEPGTALITERIAHKYFGTGDPVGKVMQLDDSLHFTVSGVLQDIPANSDFREEIYLPFSSLKAHSPWLAEEGWWWSVSKNMQCFALLKPGISAAMVDNKVLAGISEKSYPPDAAKYFRFKLQPLANIHFNPQLGGYIDKKYLLALSFIGLLLIMTTCINFINLTIAQAVGRSREIGVRKVLGSRRGQLFLLFVIETTLIAALALIMAFILVQLALPYLNGLFDMQVQVNIFRDIQLLLFLPLLLLLVVLLSGVYPGIIIAGFQPVLALRNKLSQKYIGGFSLRKALVVTQFAISQLLIISTIVIASQMRYARQADLGFQKDAIVMLPLPDRATHKLSTLRSQLSQISGIEKVTFCGNAPASASTPSTGITFDARTEGEKFSISFKAGDPDYISTFGLRLLAGRNLYPSDTIREYLLNETAVRKLGVSNQEVIGRKAVINGRSGMIVGVVNDFHNRSLHEAIDAVFITTSNEHYFNCAVKISTANLRPVLASLEKTWKGVYPAQIYKFSFLDDQIAQFYKLDNTLSHLIQLFTIISIVIGCFGLYGLITFMTARRTKEVGIRKALGASVENIIWLFSKEFIMMVLMAFVIAAPIAWWVMTNWLQTFVYRINLGAGIFVLAVIVSLMIAVLTVGYQSLKAALMNPVRSLRSE
jgi:predicted permease